MADPYARVSLSPEAGCRHETKVRCGTLCPTFEETCSFHVSRGWVARGLGRAVGAAHTPLRRSPPWSCPGPPCGCRF